MGFLWHVMCIFCATYYVHLFKRFCNILFIWFIKAQQCSESWSEHHSLRQFQLCLKLFLLHLAAWERYHELAAWEQLDYLILGNNLSSKVLRGVQSQTCIQQRKIMCWTPLRLYSWSYGDRLTSVAERIIIITVIVKYGFYWLLIVDVIGFDLTLSITWFSKEIM